MLCISILVSTTGQATCVLEQPAFLKCRDLNRFNPMFTMGRCMYRRVDYCNNWTLISSKLTAFEATFSEKQKEMNNAHLAKIEGIGSKDSYQFKRKGNEQQYQHSVKVFDKLRKAKTALDTQPITPSLLECAQTKINEGMDIVSHSQ